MDLARRQDLSVDEKRSILMNWAFDLHLILCVPKIRFGVDASNERGKLVT
jgi:hypothetical protein